MRKPCSALAVFAALSLSMFELLSGSFSYAADTDLLTQYENTGVLFSPSGSNFSVTFPVAPELSKEMRAGVEFGSASICKKGIGLRASYNQIPDCDIDALKKSILSDLKRNAADSGVLDPTIGVTETPLGLVGTFKGIRKTFAGNVFIRSDVYIKGNSMMTLLTVEPADRSPTMEAVLFKKSLKLNRETR